MGEDIKPKKTVLAQASEEAMVVDTMGGRMHVRWDKTAQATPHGQIAFFAEFLATAGLFDRWVDACPLRYSSPNASRPRDVLGTLMLGIVAGSKRYAHIAGVRGDAVAAQALGLKGLVSEDSCSVARSRQWCLQAPSRGCVRRWCAACATHWIAHGCWALMPPSCHCTGTKRVPRLATTRTSRGAPATCCTRSG